MTDVNSSSKTFNQLVDQVVSINQKKHWLFTINCGSATPQKRANIVQAFEEAECDGVRSLYVCSELNFPSGGKYYANYWYSKLSLN